MSLRIGLFSALAAAVTAASAAGQAPARPPGVDVVPSSSFAFASVKVSDLWDSPHLKDVRTAMTNPEFGFAKTIEDGVGFDPAEIERVTIFWPAASLGDQPLVLVTTRKPFDPAAVVKKLRAVDMVEHLRSRQFGGEPRPEPNPAAVGDEGSGLFVIQGGPREYGVFYLLGRRSVLFLPDDDRSELAQVYVLLGQALRGKADGPLAPALALAGEHTVVAGGRLRLLEPFVKQAPDGRGAQHLVPLLPVLAADTATLTADLGDAADVRVRLRFPTADGAAGARPLAEQLLKDWRAGLAAARKDGEGDETAAATLPLLDLAAEMLAKAAVKADGETLAADVKVDAGPAVTRALANGPAALRAKALRQKALNNLKQIGLAIHNYESATGEMPADVLDATGKPILSWRVQLLPYFDQQNLLPQVDLTKPWDDPANKAALEKMPPVFELPGRETKQKGLTYLQMPTSDKPVPGGSPIHVRGQPLKISGITDGMSNTLMVVEAADPVNWMKPDDVRYDPEKRPKLGAPKAKVVRALFGDGHVRELKSELLTDDVLRAILTRDGGEAVGYPD